ncbi:hypothetical protein [uncultured Thiodictyon sp.]|uniref:hypothetical protein n=1 Tax=uncultured Thiodictyon sp. TaxID=1846217 RepID=UPI0025D1899D|nr:hypothetical protein [uncultured Thiodictyon sp.]
MAPILGTCPRCRGTDTIAAYLADPETRACWSALEQRLGAHPAVLSRVLPYLDLHAPDANAMHLPKLRRLIGELADLVLSDPQTPAEVWALAMDAAMDARQAGTLRTPLPDGFGWLKSVAIAKAKDPAACAAARQLARAAPVGAAPGRDATADAALRELEDDVRHWFNLVHLGLGGPGAATVLADLQAKYEAATGGRWIDPAAEPAP